MKMYTAIGFYPDNGQKFNTFLNAGNADEALLIVEDQNPCLIVCGVIEGIHPSMDSDGYITGSEVE
uniref:Phage protein n=1 Tax=viral metagenome TaxID=1070528 RepID=A0A6M3XZV6_9ZZZZ